MSQATSGLPATLDSAGRPKPRTLFGHPLGLFILFFTEMWERFSFYSMRGILVLYMTNVLLVAGGHADQIYGAYLGFVYAATFIGGMLADRLLGQRRAIYIGGFLMSLAQFTLTTHALMIRGGHSYDSLMPMFFTGLGLLACGNGFFKPNISTIVGTLYEAGDARRDSAFTIFYMGINIGATAASFSGGIAEKWGWFIGYLLAGIGMIASLVIFFLGRHSIAGSGLPPQGATLVGGRFGIPNGLLLLVGVCAFIPLAGYMMARPAWVQDLALYISVPVLAYLLWEAARPFHKQAGTSAGGSTITAIVVALLGFALFVAYQASAPRQLAVGTLTLTLPAYAWIAPLVLMLACIIWLISRGVRTEEGGRMVVIVVLCCFSMLFWGFFELAGSTITRFTQQRIDRMLFGWEVPAAWLVNFVNPFLIILLSIPFSWLWVWLDRKKLEPSSPFKFAMGLVQLGLGFLSLWAGAAHAGDTGKCSMSWLVLAFFLFTTGELCLSPVGLSMITKLSPARLVGMFMGVWFLASALANVFAGKIGGMTQESGFAAVFLLIAGITGAAAVVLFILAPMLKKIMHGVR